MGYTLPARVVQDDTDAIVLYQAPGTICKKRTGKRGGPRGRNLTDWDGGYEDVMWRAPGKLRLYVPGTAHSVLRDWDTDRRVAGAWYVNLEAPWTRTAIGFDSHDHVLDLEVADDLSSWSWKDEDELAWSVSRGVLSVTEAEAIRAEGERVIEAIDRRAWPFDRDWSGWAPDPAWTVPGVPDGWDRP